MHRIEHCEFTSDEMMEEIARRGYAVMAQPGYSWIDKRYLHTYERYLSPETLGQMRFADFLRRGICICGSSDSPVQSLDPWLQMLGMTQFYREEESVTPMRPCAVIRFIRPGRFWRRKSGGCCSPACGRTSLLRIGISFRFPRQSWEISGRLTHGTAESLPVDGRGRRQSWRGCSFADRKKSERKIKRENCSFFYVSSRKSVMIGIEKYNGIRGWNYEQNYYGCQRVRERRA